MEGKKEIWHPVKDFEGFYEVSNTNKIRSVERYVNGRCGNKCLRKGKELSPTINKQTGYVLVVLSKNGKTRGFNMHTIVAEAFPEICGEKKEGYEIDHINFDRTDNRPENIRYVPKLFNQKRHKPKPFVPVYGAKEPLCIENLKTGEKKYFIRRDKAADFLGMRHSTLLRYYIRKGTPYKQTFLIYTINESDIHYWEAKQINHPSEEQVNYFEKGIVP